MSTPFPLEDEAARQGTGQVWDPWKGNQSQPFFKGLGIGDLVTGLGSGAAKGEALLAGAMHALSNLDGIPQSQMSDERLQRETVSKQQSQSFSDFADQVDQDAQMRVRALAVDPTTQGAASSILHGLGEGGWLVTTGSLLGGPAAAAGLTGGAEGVSSYKEAKGSGLDETAAREEAAFSAFTSGAGALLPAGVGSTLLRKVLSGAAGNVGFGMANRYGDHLILEHAGYQEMADQQRVLDGTQMLADLVMGAGFGAVAHLHGHDIKQADQNTSLNVAPDDAARAVALAAADRASSVGVPVDPAAAAAHSAALTKASIDLMSDRTVDVTDTGVSQADFARRAPRDISHPAALLMETLRDSPLAHEEAALKALEDQYAGMISGKAPAGAPLRPEGSPSSPSPTAPMGPRWYADRGAIPGEASHYLDVQGEDLDTARAAVIEHNVEGSGNSTWEAVLPEGKSLGIFNTAADAARAAEHAVPRETVKPIDWTHEIPKNEMELTPAQRGIEQRFTQQIGSDYEKAKADYSAIPETLGGKVINTDIARELSPDYLKDRTQSAAVHEPASALMKRLYAEKLTQPPGPGEDNTVLFTGGGAGAGKSTAVAGALGATAERSQIVYDTNLNGAKSAIAKIQQARTAGKTVKIAYVYREPIEALENGALSRAMKQERKHGSGRTVPVKDHIDTHIGSNETIRKIAEHFKGDPGVEITTIDNSRGAGKQAIIPMEELPRLEYNEVHGKAIETLDRQFAAGKISPAVYRGFAGREPPARLPAAAEPSAPAPGLGGASGGESGPQRAGGNPDAVAGQSVFTPSGRRIEVKPKLVEAKDLLTSDQEGYPQEIQPRQRGSRVASAAQVSDISKNLKPELLGESATADTGAPITGPDNAVESGNGRIMALRDVYANNPERAAAYKKFLEAQGHDIKGFKEPVLVRERQTPMSPEDRQAFAVEANQTATARFSPVEQAQADAKNVGPIMMSKLASGDLTTAANAPFMRDFVATVPMSERNELMGADGIASQAGVRRAQAAILAKAYGASPGADQTLARILESTDTEMKSTLNALQDAAPAFARLQQMVADGTLGPEYDIAPAIIQAVEDVARIRGQGMSLTQHLAQKDMLSPTALATKAFYDEAGDRLVGRERAAKALMDYADGAMAQRINQGNLFSDAPVAPSQLMQKAVAPKTTDMFGLRTPSAGFKAASLDQLAAHTAEVSKPMAQRMKEAAAANTPAEMALAATPNMEIPTDSGTTERARAALMAADQAAASTEGKATTSLDTAANCAGLKGAA